MPNPAGAEPGSDLVAVGADLAPGTVLAAYRAGLFPMPTEAGLGWWSPDPRGILPLDGLAESRSLRRSRRRFDVRIDSDFEAVVMACATTRNEGQWITPAVQAAYVELHRLGFAHSFECWTLGPSPQLVGGLYGVAIGGLFAGESMFHRVADASKVALAALVDELRRGDGALLDVQWRTPHLASLGVVEVSRPAYLRLLAAALTLPLPAVFAGLPPTAVPST